MSRSAGVVRPPRRFASRAAALAAPVVGAPASGQVLGANDRINIGGIGLGGRGNALLGDLLKRQADPGWNIRVVAVCDVYDVRRDKAAERCGGKGFTYHEELLEMPDLDAVFVATPDHWHASISMDAMRAGKDVYCEKPMTLYWHEAKRVAQVEKRTGVVFQCGAQSASDGRYWRARELIQEGAVGKLIWSTTGYYRNVPQGDWNYRIDPEAKPGVNLDWKRYLGPAEQRPWDPERFFRFRKFWDYSGGLATDLLYHSLAHLSVALGFPFPLRVSAAGGIYVHHDREVPDTYVSYIDFPPERPEVTGGHTCCLFSTQGNQTGVTELIRGQKATMQFGAGVAIEPQEPYAHELARREVPPLPRPDHMSNWLECIRTRERPALCAERAYPVMVAIALGVRAYRENKIIEFDPVKQDVVD